MIGVGNGAEIKVSGTLQSRWLCMSMYVDSRERRYVGGPSRSCPCP